MKQFTSLFLLLLLCIGGFAQQLSLSFVGEDARTHSYMQLTRVVITDNTQGWTETIVYPDTNIIMQVSTVGINENVNAEFGLDKNNPNPFNGTTDVKLTLVESGVVNMEIMDITGRSVEAWNALSLPIGVHQFHINIADAGIYFLTARQNGKTSFVKMVNNGNGDGNMIEYVGVNTLPLQSKNSIKGIINHTFALGDAMTYKGYAMVEGEEVEGETIEQVQRISETITLPIRTTGLPCPGVPTLTDYDGNIYNTVQIGTQCWMRENLKTLHYADGTEIPRDDNPNMIDPSYAYPDNMINNVSTLGLLYNWPAVMNGGTSSDGNPSGVQGVCPTGWHVPSDAEWKELELTVGVPSGELDNMNAFRGNVAASLAGGNVNTWTNSSTAGAAGNYNDENHNLTGFSALPAGTSEGMAVGIKENALFWSSTLYTQYNAITRNIHYTQTGIRRNNIEKALCGSVRCVMN